MSSGTDCDIKIWAKVTWQQAVTQTAQAVSQYQGLREGPYSDGHDEGLPGGQQQGGHEGGDERPDQAAVLAIPGCAKHGQLAALPCVAAAADR